MSRIDQIARDEKVLALKREAFSARREIATRRWRLVKGRSRSALGSVEGMTASFSAGLLFGALKKSPHADDSEARAAQSRAEGSDRLPGEDRDAHVLDMVKSVGTSLVARYLFTKVYAEELADGADASAEAGLAGQTHAVGTSS